MAPRRYISLLTLLLCALVSLQQVAPVRRSAVGRGAVGRSPLPIPVAFEEELAEETAAVISRIQHVVRLPRSRVPRDPSGAKAWVLLSSVDASPLDVGARRRAAELPRRQPPPDDHSRQV